MTGPVSGPVAPTWPQISAMAEHVDHEMSRLLWIGETLRCWRILLPDTILRALRVAYAAHARVLLEFFHDGRPGYVGVRKTHGGDVDLWLGDFAPPIGARPWVPSSGHEDRLLDADKLLAHLSTGRLAPPRAHIPEWGDRGDRAWVRSVIEQVRTELSAAGRWDLFPQTKGALAETASLHT